MIKYEIAGYFTPKTFEVLPSISINSINSTAYSILLGWLQFKLDIQIYK